ncbi:hypothetical protein [Deinococcus maricopensis]|uniref:Uncharacterized protein n=1 Tax=Deinococcus maricopensis (strain DSM 21211 / LMG 22137 / NRRL B-23946 / LB-34) TaxID=709986 RepID=E8U615_DEIML|nr:hypothetical protein [Deinococcus maricopensis]ADV66504.1 hypothetical protein Deima_0849 [Deinococcus maricopensis DSM 21211]
MTKKRAQNNENPGLEMHAVWSRAIERQARQLGSECAGTAGMAQIAAGVARGDLASVQQLAVRAQVADGDTWQLLQGDVAWMRDSDALELLPLLHEAGCRPGAAHVQQACAALLGKLRQEARPDQFARELGKALLASGEALTFLRGGILPASLAFSRAWMPLIGRSSAWRLTPWLQQGVRRDLEKHGRLRWRPNLLQPEVTWLLGEVAQHAGGTASSQTARLAAFMTAEMGNIARRTAEECGIIEAPALDPRHGLEDALIAAGYNPYH